MLSTILEEATKSTIDSGLDLQVVYWNEVRDEVYKVNPQLAKICDEIDPGKKHPLLKIRYPYGGKIIDRGKLNLPTSKGRLISINDAKVPASIQKQLNYCSIPLSLILHNDNEVFVDTNERVIPLNYFKPGDLFGVFESMNSITDSFAEPPIWSVTAGARSVFMIPRITDKVGHNRIRKEFSINKEVPTDLADQWDIFKGIYRRSGGVDCWDNVVLMFTDSWFNPEKEDISWLKFHKYLFKICWQQMQLLREAPKFSLLWAAFGNEISNRNLKPRAYIIDTLKHLISIANGVGVAFKPATEETALPVSIFQKAYVDYYNLKSYIPTLMQPCKLQNINEQAYYSLAFPTVLESSPYAKNAPSIIEDERDIRKLLHTLIRTINHGNAIINPIRNVKYEFFHTDTDPYGEILSSKDITISDTRFNHIGLKELRNRVFCATSHFFRGCIRVSLIDEETNR